jgi:RHS repeat-associated protein
MSRLIRIEWGAGSNKVTQYRYNSIGQRTETIEKTGSTITAHYRYLYDGLMPLCRYNGGQTAAHIDRRYYSQGEERKENGAWVSYYYCRDHLGSIREVVKGDGTLAARYDYDPYGLRLTRYQAASYTNCDFGYTGHITQHSPVSGQSEIVLTLYRAYDPVHARWLTPDPIGEAGGLNLYEYCLGNPINGIDPMGLEFWTWGDSDSEDRLPSAGEMAESTAHFIQGMGDNISFGATRKGRDAIWGNDYTDP